MKKIFVILDAMTTGNIPDVRNYFNYFNDVDYKLVMVNNYFEHEMHSLNDYHLKYMLIDLNFLIHFRTGPEFREELKRRIIKTRKLGFRIVLCNLWEDSNTFHLTKENIYRLLQECEIKKFYILPAGKSYFWAMMYNRYNNWVMNWYHQDKRFDFLYLNKRPRPIRKHLYQLLKKTDLLDNSLYSWWDDSENIRIRLPEEYEVPDFKKDYPITGQDQNIWYLPYEHTKVSLVSETMDNKNYPYRGFITEKIWKPIVCEHPFVVMSYYDYLKELKELGFKTFSNVWDESYDSVTNPYRRAEEIVKMLPTIKKLDAKILYEQTADIRAHNKKLFFDKNHLCAVVTTDIKKALFEGIEKEFVEKTNKTLKPPPHIGTTWT